MDPYHKTEHTSPIKGLVKFISITALFKRLIILFEPDEYSVSIPHNGYLNFVLIEKSGLKLFRLVCLNGNAE